MKIENTFEVSGGQWKKWNDQERKLFNDLLSFSLSNPVLMNHPMAPATCEPYWKTVAWNHSWLAADFLREQRKMKK